MCTYVRTCARTSAVNLRRYGDTPQTITIYDLIEISLLCAAHATVKFSGVKLCLPKVQLQCVITGLKSN